MKLPDIKLRFWMGKGELGKLALALQGFWIKVQAALEWPLQQLDPMTAPIELVDLIAWQREVERLGLEPEQIYRTRVTYAYQFATGAGSVAGWKDMFEKLGYPHVAQDERLKHIDWDVISLKIRDGDLSDVPDLLDTVIRQYGRTCRRYQYTTYLEMPLQAKPQSFEGEYDVSIVSTPMEVALLPRIQSVESEYDVSTVTTPLDVALLPRIQSIEGEYDVSIITTSQEVALLPSIQNMDMDFECVVVQL